MTDRHPERWDRERRLRTTREYSAVKAQSDALRGRFCLLLAHARAGEPTRVGFVASKKGVGGAVQRNRARRRLREIVRRRFPRLAPTGHWLVFIAYRSTLSAPYQDLASDVEALLERAGALGRAGSADV